MVAQESSLTEIEDLYLDCCGGQMNVYKRWCFPGIHAHMHKRKYKTSCHLNKVCGVVDRVISRWTGFLIVILHHNYERYDHWVKLDTSGPIYAILAASCEFVVLHSKSHFNIGEKWRLKLMSKLCGYCSTWSVSNNKHNYLYTPICQRICRC